MKSITIAGGCFWGVEAYFDQFDGVIFSEVGYANGRTINPTYQDVCNGSGHAEVVTILFDDSIISLDEVLNHYYKIIDPTSKNKQGNDVGEQYRTGVYYESPEDHQIIVKSLKALQQHYDEDIAIEVMPLLNLYRAEREHQNYLRKNPNGYCHIPENLLSLSIKQ